jgi:hypothetical protein
MKLDEAAMKAATPLKSTGGEFTAGLMGGPAPLGGSQGVSGESVGSTWGSAFKTGFSGSMGGLSQVIIGALQGGGNVGHSIGALIGDGIGKSLAAVLPKGLTNALGGLVGQIIPGIGALIGPLLSTMISKLWGGIKNLFGGGEEGTQVNPARDAELAKYGGSGTGAGSGFANLAAQLSAISGEEGGGALFHALMGADTMEKFNAAMTAINTALAGATTGVDTTTAATDGLNIALTGSDAALAALGATQEAVVATMLAGFDALIAKLSEFIAAMGAANAMALPDVGAGPQLVDAAALPDEIPSAANEGVFSRPTLAMVGDAHEPEYVLHKSTVDNLRRGGGSGGQHVIVNLNGTFLGPAEWLRGQVTQAVLESIKAGGEQYKTFERLSRGVAPA